MSKTKVPAFILALHFVLASLDGQGRPICLVSIQTEGSVPEAPGILTCIDNLDGKPYSEPEANACLESLKAMNFFERVEMRKEPIQPEKISLAFFLESRSLELNSVAFDLPDPDRANFLAWSQDKVRLLEKGAAYDKQIALQTAHAIEFFYQREGVISKVSTLTSLDYGAGTASVTFHVTTGPHLPQPDLVPPYTIECHPTVSGLDWTDVDEGAPLPLVESVITLRSTGTCFSPQKLRSDEEALRQLGIFDRVEMSYSGTADRKQISLRLRTKPLPLESIKQQYYGLAPSRVCEESLRGSETPLSYSRTAINALRRKLITDCGDANSAADAYEQDVPLEGARLKVLFHVLRYPRYQLLINGKELASP